MQKIAGITPADETWEMKIKVLKEDVEHHVKEEEGEMFPDARKFLGEKRLIELGDGVEGAPADTRKKAPLTSSIYDITEPSRPRWK